MIKVLKPLVDSSSGKGKCQERQHRKWVEKKK